MLSSVAANPITDGVNVVPSPVACDENSCHQSQFTPSAARSAMRLEPKWTPIASRRTSAIGSVIRIVIAKTPAAIAGDATTRCHPLRHACRIMGSGEEPIGQHQILEPRHPFQRPLHAGFAA